MTFLHKSLLIFAIVVIAACESSPAWLMTHPNKKTVRSNGIEFTLAEGGLGWWAYPSVSSFSAIDKVAIKAAAISAIEDVTGCRVAGAEFAGELVVQAKTDCRHPAKSLGR